jgi:hypothetical protein
MMGEHHHEESRIIVGIWEFSTTETQSTVENGG